MRFPFGMSAPKRQNDDEGGIVERTIDNWSLRLWGPTPVNRTVGIRSGKIRCTHRASRTRTRICVERDLEVSGF